MVHEALGHGIASCLTGDKILSISTVALQNAAASRLVSAAGTSANFTIGICSLIFLRRMRTFTAGTYFLWIFGAYNLLNIGYLAVSAVLNTGDWAYVISGLSPFWFWRCVLGVTGGLLYFLSLHWIANALRDVLNRGKVAVSDLRPLILPAYLAGGTVMTLASVLNPIGPGLILISGVGASFGLNCGLLFIPGMVATSIPSEATIRYPLPFSMGWLALAIVVSGVFIGLLGPGLHFSH